MITGIIAAAMFFCVLPTQAQTSPFEPEMQTAQAPEVNLLICYKIKTGFGSRIIIDAVPVKTRALTGANADEMLNDLIAELGKRGLLAGVKGLDRPARASISILSWEAIRPNFIYTTEQLQTPNLPE